MCGPELFRLKNQKTLWWSEQACPKIRWQQIVFRWPKGIVLGSNGSQQDYLIGFRKYAA